MYRIFVLSMLLFSKEAFNQQLLHYKFDFYTPKSGLSSIYARKIIQDPFGFIWVGTIDGLNRFNGKQFIKYNQNNTPGHKLTGTDIRDIVIDTASTSLWVVNSYGGIDQISYLTGEVIYQYYQTRDPKARNILFNTLVIHKGQLFIGSSEGLFVLDIKSKSLKKVAFKDSFSSVVLAPIINKLLIDSKGSLWVFCERLGVFILDIETKALISSCHSNVPTVPGIRFYDACQLRNDDVLCGTNMGLVTYSTDNNKNTTLVKNPFSRHLKMLQGDVYACNQDKVGNVWVSQTNSFICIDSAAHTSKIVKDNKIRGEADWLFSVYTIFFDSAENLWLGCQQGLAYAVSNPTPFLQFTKSTNAETKIEHAYYLEPVSDSIIYSCAQEGLYKVNIRTGTIDAIQTNRPYYHFFIDPFGRKITANVDGTFLLEDNHLIPIQKIYPVFSSLGKIVINSHCQLGDSMLMLGTENHRGVFAWNFKKNYIREFSEASATHKLNENTVNLLFKDSYGRVWVLGDHSITVIDPRSFKSQLLLLENPADKTFFSIFFDVTEVKNNYYIASYGAGVIVLDSNLRFKKLLSSKDGLTANSVYKTIPWKDSLLFVSSNNGVSQIKLAAPFEITKYFESDGLHGDVFEENSGSTYHDKIFLGGQGGITMVDPTLLQKPVYNARVYVDQIKMETKSGVIDTSNFSIKSISIPNDVLQTTIYFSFTDYLNPLRNRFSYRIKELSHEWIHLYNQDYVNIIGLAPGTYTLEMKASNQSGQLNIVSNSLLIKMIPKWYQTVLFKIVVILLIGAFFYSVYRVRLAQIKKQQNIRKEIAEDLHDDIGSTLNAVKVYTHLAQREPQNDEYLKHIENSLREVSLSLRDIIWVLDQSEDNLKQLLERIKNYAMPLSQAQNICFTYDIADGDYNIRISKTEKRNLLLIAKESINNSVKHAKCTKISLSIGSMTGGIYLKITDDGQGFDVDNPSSGYGLKNIIQRAKQIKYKSSINSDIGKGTNIILRSK